MTARVTARARTREDRAGDPLDGLVNLFDLGIVLAVAFLLAALSSVDLTSTVLQQDAKGSDAVKVPPDSVIANEDDTVRGIELQPGQRVVGRGEQVGTVYRLNDGRTVIVGPDGKALDGSATEPKGSGSDGQQTTPTEPPAGSAPQTTPSVPPVPDSPSSNSAPDQSSPPVTTTPQPKTGSP